MDSVNKRVQLVFADGHQGVFAQLWLRDSCTCEECVHPVTHQRTHQLADSRKAELLGVSKSAETWRFKFRDHETTYAENWLRAHCQCGFCRPQTVSHGGSLLRRGAKSWKSPWRPRYFDNEQLNEARLTELIEALWRDGLCVVQGVGRNRGEVAAFAERIGYLRETNYGRIFDVEAVPEPEHLAYTGVALPLHTDNPYREPAPGIQLLHCIEAADLGGESIFSDGFAAALELHATSPEAFDTLSRLRVPFRYRDTSCDHRHQRALIETEAGRVQAIFFNDRSMEPTLFSLADTERFYAAYAAFEGFLEAFKIRVAVAPGQLVIFDNRRILHGREEFSVGATSRLLQGCYVDWDGVLGRARAAGVDVDV